jgi:hypothetical protein
MIETGAIASGLIVGYLLVSVTESLSHNKLLHANKRRVKTWEKLGKPGVYMHSSWYSHHVVHHHLTFKKNHVTMFESESEERKLREYLLLKQKEEVVLDSYGLRIGSFKKKIEYLYTHILQLTLVCYFGGLWFTTGVSLIIVFYIWLAEYLHPYTHLPYSESLKSASVLMRPFIRSRYFKYLLQHHYLHHKYKDCNFNLVLGGDFLLRSHRSPCREDLIEMKELGILVHESSKQAM